MIRIAPTALVLLAAGALCWAQAEPDYFPAQPGRSWTYTLTLKANGKQKKIEYTTTVERVEEVEGHSCAVFVSRSAERLIKQEWYAISAERVVNVQQKGGSRPAQVFSKRVIFERAAAAQLDDGDPKPSWEWTCSDGSSGTVALVRRERLFVPKVGDFKDCLVIVDRGVFTTGKGDAKTVARTTDHTLWFAPDLGLVKETVIVKKPDGSVSFHTEAVLTKFQTP